MNFELTDSFKRKAKKLCLKNHRLASQIKKQFRIFSEDPLHPSLKLHKLQGKRSDQYAMWVLADLRALATKANDVFIFSDLITHDEY